MLKVIVAPLVGGVIGYITNDLAIKMLFHPRKSVYIGKWHVPFTPGLIPAQKKRIAKSLGEMVSRNLLDGDTIRLMALSDEMMGKLRGSVQRMLEENAQQTDTVRSLIERYVSSETVDLYAEKISRGVTACVMAEMEKKNAGKMISHAVMDILRQKMQNTFFMGILDDRMLVGMEDVLAVRLNEAIQKHGPEMLERELLKTEQNLLDKRVCDLTAQYQGRIPELVDMLTRAYAEALNRYLDIVLEKVNIGAIVESKVNSFSSAELEALIFGVMKRELNAIVNLGAVLGFLMGFVNLLF